MNPRVIFLALATNGFYRRGNKSVIVADFTINITARERSKTHKLAEKLLNTT